MTNSANNAPLNVTTRTLSSGRKAFATLPNNAPQILARDVIFEENLALVWPYQTLERRRVFHGLFSRFHRQILYGCKNANCQTPTCLSYQKRISKRPFRGFTILSARILAMFLASQDDSEESLCPHESRTLSEVPDEKSKRRISNEPKSSRTAPSSTMNLRSAPTRITPEPESTSFITRKGSANPKTHNGNIYPDKARVEKELLDLDAEKMVKKKDELRTEKDTRSFTQNLFDTSSMRMLEEGIHPAVLLRWVPWFDKAKINLSTKAMNRGNEHTVEDIVTRYKSLHNPDRIELDVPMNMNGGKPAESASLMESVFGKQSEMKYEGHDKTLPNVENSVVRPTDSKATSNNSKDSNSSLRERGVHLKQQNDVKTTGNLTSPAANPAPEVRAPIEGSNSLTTIESLSMNLLKHTIDNESATNLTSQNKTSLNSPQTLRIFTLENIRALVASVSKVHPKLLGENRFLRLLGRTPTPSRRTAFAHCVPTLRERDIAFGTQSIVSILSSIDALLKSFLARAENGSSWFSRSVGFSEIVHAFRLLRDIDQHPSSIFPSLWISVGKIHISTNMLSRSTFIRTSKSSKSDSFLADDSFDQEFFSAGILNDSEAAHVVKIALASLVASIPEKDPETWYRFRTFRAMGVIERRSKSQNGNKEFLESLLELMDSFDDEMALSLVIRLVRAVAARRCMSKMSKCQETGTKENEESKIRDDDFMDVIIREILTDDSVGSFSAPLTNPELPKRSFLLTIAEREEKLQEVRDGRCLNIAIVAEWLRSVISREWDGKAEVSRLGAVGSALEFLSSIHRLTDSLKVDLDPGVFYNFTLANRLEVMNTPTEWVTSRQDRNTVHLLSYPFIFLPTTLVSFYRAINHAAMFKAFESSIIAVKLEAQMTFMDPNTGRGEIRFRDRLKTATSSYLVLAIRREDVLTDALNQLWRRERRELMRPLKVRMGMDEGEAGVDHGGVQQEFFRVALSESMRPDYGLFTTDAQTQMSWFQPCSLEPWYKFELLGLLTSLAVYNGVTLPVTFPLALYRKLLDLPVTELQHIEDGWPSLTKGLEDLLTFEDDHGEVEVEDVFVISYVFSVEALGKTIYVDMDKIGRDDEWPSSRGSIQDGETENAQSRIDEGLPLPSCAPDKCSNSSAPSADGSSGWIALEASNEPTVTHRMQDASRARTNSITSQARMVTAMNRDQYVNDYIFWLTDKSIRPQYEAFARGFYTCLDKKATTMLSPQLLKGVVEGTQEIDIDELKKTASYEGGYYEEHPTIISFWSIVRELPIEKLRRLLEFVTASDRIPVNGICTILFVIQKNGTEDDRLPSSLTCFGRLLLPAYSSREILKEKLCIAIEHSKGFGMK